MTNTSEFSLPQLPNPFTPMAFLPPEQAHEKTVTTYVLVGTLGVLAWDILTHLDTDYKLLTRRRVGVPTLTYFLSRWSSLFYSASSAIFETTQVDNCKVFSKVICAAYHPAVSATTLLFLFRVRALYNGNKYITAFFLVIWLAILGTSLLIIASVTGVHIGNTKYCLLKGFHPYSSSSSIVIGVFDTCVFVATAWRLLANAPHAGRNSDAGRFGLFGKYLPRFSRALLQDGQKYYMVAMVSNLLVLVMTYAPGIPTVYRPFFLIPSVGLTNIVACRVFRNTKLGRYDEVNSTGTLSTMFRQSGHSGPVFVQTRDLSTVHSINEGNLNRPRISDTDLLPSGHSAEKLPQLSITALGV